jgi:uncharacterized protein YfdQ (DUF2303 family)
MSQRAAAEAVELVAMEQMSESQVQPTRAVAAAVAVTAAESDTTEAQAVQEL